NTATQQMVAQFADSANLALSGTYQKAFSWPATGTVGTGYTATLRATVGGVAKTLAQDNFSIIAPPVQLDVALTALKQARTLVLDAVHDERNHGLDTIAGTNVHGKLGVAGPAINVNGPIFTQGTLGSSGRPLQLDLTTGAAQAVFAAAPDRPAIVTNQYGQG